MVFSLKNNSQLTRRGHVVWLQISNDVIFFFKKTKDPEKSHAKNKQSLSKKKACKKLITANLFSSVSNQAKLPNLIFYDKNNLNSIKMKICDLLTNEKTDW